MTELDAEWTGRWAADRLEKREEVQKVSLIAPQILQITRKELRPFVACTIASQRVEPPAINPLLKSFPQIEFIANIPSESFWTGAAIAFASRHRAAFGGMGDLCSAVSLPNPREHVHREFDFVERGLRQHKGIGLERVHDRKYVVKRHQLSDLSVVLCNAYELTADHVRTAHDRYGAFNVLLITNPNGGPTSSAKTAAESMGAKIYKWGEFLGQLNRR